VGQMWVTVVTHTLVGLGRGRAVVRGGGA
jgi:hypothetical protein